MARLNLAMGRPRGTSKSTTLERLWAKTIIRGECWCFIGAHDRAGYGQLKMPIGDGQWRPRRAHRVAFELFYGVIPAHRLVLHRCDNPPCWRPLHLFAGTDRDNSEDALAKGRLAIGGRNGSAKLTEADVLEIRHRLQKGTRQDRLAAEYGVSKMLVSLIARGRLWRHVV